MLSDFDDEALYFERVDEIVEHVRGMFTAGYKMYHALLKIRAQGCSCSMLNETCPSCLAGETLGEDGDDAP